MKLSKKIALCGVSAALSAVFLSFVKFAPTGKLSLFALSSAAVMIPLAKRLNGGALLTVAAAALTGFITGGITVLLPYVLFFGIHPIINSYLDRTKLKGLQGYIVKLIIKLVYFNIVLYVVYKLAVITALFPIAAEFYVIAAIVSAAFIPYDYLMQLLQKRIAYLIGYYLKF